MPASLWELAQGNMEKLIHARDERIAALEAALDKAATNTIEHLTRIATLEAENERMQKLLMSTWKGEQ
jgi:hypothetical protein